MVEFKIKSKIIGFGHPCYVIAEMSANHGRDLKRALSIVRKAKESGADAIKLQTFTPDTMTLKSSKSWFQIRKHRIWGGRTLYDIYSEGSTPWKWHKQIMKEANRVGLDCFSTPFDSSAVDFLEDIGMPVYKISSFELIDDPLLRCVARTRKPIILSTGMATIKEIEHALLILRKEGAKDIALLKCVSSYPAHPSQMNIRTISDMAQRFNVPVGLSDHSLGILAATTAVSIGASIIEKHFCLDHNKKTLDSSFSMSPGEFKNLVKAVREVEKVLGCSFYGSDKNEQESLRFRKSIFTCCKINKGDKFTLNNIRVVRPGQGLSPKYFSRILGTKAQADIDEAEPLNAGIIEKGILKY